MLMKRTKHIGIRKPHLPNKVILNFSVYRYYAAARKILFVFQGENLLDKFNVFSFFCSEEPNSFVEIISRLCVRKGSLGLLIMRDIKSSFRLICMQIKSLIKTIEIA